MALSVGNPIRGYVKEAINEGADTRQHPEGSVSVWVGSNVLFRGSGYSLLM